MPLVCLLAVPVNLPAESCPGVPEYPEITGSIACPDGADATVYPSAVPAELPGTTAEAPFNPDRSATIDAPPEVGSGSRFFVDWTGPANAGDYVTIAVPDSSGGEYRNYGYVQDGSPLQLVAPDEPGNYELRYLERASSDILARQAVTVSAASATLESAGNVNSGSTFDVRWSGPGNQGDYITIATPGTPGGEYHNYTYVQQGSPLELTAPDAPGNYEIRYIQRQSRTILAARAIDVMPVSATIRADAVLQPGARFEINWTGPANQSDYITIATPGTPGGEYHNYAYVQRGSPLELTAPEEVGTYEVRYIQRQSRTILARQTVRVEN